jgi:CDP-diacylglycerol--glycerol-3-phosphate 3-phosphatidyltransferase
VNVPIALTLVRIVLVPLVIVFLISSDRVHVLIAAVIFIAASLTDWLDGRMARRWNQVTRLGTLLDPVADKLLVAAALIALVQIDMVDAWVAVVIIGRELAVTGLRSLASARGAGFGASMLGKIKMASQVTAILLLILGQNGAQPFLWLGQIALWVVLLTALGSAVDYYRTYQSPSAPDASRVADFEEARQRASRRTG